RSSAGVRVKATATCAVMALATVMSLLVQSAPAYATSSARATIIQGDSCTLSLVEAMGDARVARSGRHVRVFVTGALPAGDEFDISLWKPTSSSCAQIGATSPT